MIASAVRYNTREFGCYKEINRETSMNRGNYLLTAKLTAILRLANAMDRSHYQKVKALNVTLKDRILYLVVDSARDVSLELGLLKDKKEFFEEVFGIRLVMRRKEEDNGGGFCMKFKEFDKPEYFVNRELSWIKFDDRVLSEARDKNLPLFERLKFFEYHLIQSG